GFGRVFLCPGLCPAKEEALLGGETIDVRGTRLALERFHVGVVSDVESAQIGNRFARYELALQMQTRLNLKTAELINHTISAFIEILLVAFSPPVFQVALRVKLGARIIVAVRNLMADDSSDRSIINRIVCVGVEKWRLQDARRKRDIVIERAVAGVDGRRRHTPLLPVNWFVDLVEVAHLI